MTKLNMLRYYEMVETLENEKKSIKDQLDGYEFSIKNIQDDKVHLNEQNGELNKEYSVSLHLSVCMVMALLFLILNQKI